MIISSEGIEFNALKEFSKFITDLELLGIVQLREALTDKKGNILIKDLVYVRESSIKKLESIADQYTPSFKIKTTPELTAKIRKALANSIIPIVNETEKSFISILFAKNPSGMQNVESLINNAFYTDLLVLALYEIMIEDNDFFHHIVRMGLICLGTVIQKSYAIKLIHRNAFLTGLCADLILFRTNYWKNSNLDDMLMIELTKLNVQIAGNLGMSEEIITAIQDHVIRGVYVVDMPEPVDFELLKQNPMLGHSSNEKEKNVTPSENEHYEETVKILTEALKITRFISEANKKLTDSDDIVQRLITMFAYNVEKKNFDAELADPMIDCFRQYEKIIKRMRKIARLENLCMHPPSAWAYPKPKAVQILCKNSHHTCLHYVSGWNINVITAQEAIGYIGTSLRPGSYPKCRLEQQLAELDE
ncbi:MAG TPA: hypothetical protein PLX69_11115 [Leptospiraceae bacterium]|nr:hypothetical protein [Leptospiraceae bacterium]HRG75098.1 hypothetical protein [Leptospiraceae bacterium]